METHSKTRTTTVRAEGETRLNNNGRAHELGRSESLQAPVVLGDAQRLLELQVAQGVPMPFDFVNFAQSPHHVRVVLQTPDQMQHIGGVHLHPQLGKVDANAVFEAVNGALPVGVPRRHRLHHVTNLEELPLGTTETEAVVKATMQSGKEVTSRRTSGSYDEARVLAVSDVARAAMLDYSL